MKYLVTIALSFLVGCGQPHVTPVVVEPNDTHLCEGACQNLRRLGCPEGFPLEDGTTCEQFCVDTQRNGHALNLLCVSTLNSCEKQDRCLTPRDPLQ